MKKIKAAQPESQSKRRITFSRLEVFRRRRRSAATQQHSSSAVENTVQGESSLDRHKPLYEENARKSPEIYERVVFPPFPSEFMNAVSEDFTLPDEYTRVTKNEPGYSELMLVSPSPKPDVKVQFGKNNVNNSDLADTVPIEDVPPSLLKMSPEKKDDNLPDTRTVSPILLHKPATTRSHIYSRRMKGLNSSVRSKRLIPKQIPLLLDHEVMKKINENLPELSQIDSNTDWRKEQEDSVSLLNENDAGNNFFQRERISRLSKFEYDNLKANNGEVLAAFCEHEVVIIVQDSLITFLSTNKQINNGEVARSEMQLSMNRVFTSNVSTNRSVCACMEMVLMNQNSEEQQLLVLIYSFNQLTGISRVCSINLPKLPMQVSNLKICPVQDCAFVACWTKDNNTSTQIVKYSMDDEFQAVLASIELNSVNGCVSSLHALKGCQKVVLGATATGVIIWDLHSGHVLKTVDFEGLVWSSCLWCDEDRGFLFSALGTDKSIQITAANLTNGKFKVLRQYTVPEVFSQSSGLHIQHGLVTSVYPEGCVVWQLSSSKTILKAVTDLQLFLCKSNLICISSNGDASDTVIRVLDVTKLQEVSL